MRFKSRKAVVEAIMEIDEPFISTHDDADGMISGLYMARLFDSIGVEVNFEFPEKFGDCDPEVNIVLDQVPLDPDQDAIVIDHHPQHFKRRGYEYQLWYDNVPTSLMVYHLAKKEIPNEEWKVAVGLVGDGQAELIPSEIWDQHPELFHARLSIYQRGSDMNIYRNPLYTMLSSGINAISRMEEEDNYGPTLGYQIAKKVESPLELVIHATCEKAKQLQKKEKNRIIYDCAPIDLGKVVFWEIDSIYKMESYMATILESKEKKTVVVINSGSTRVAIRGDHAFWVKEKLPEFPIDGHLKYMGGVLEEHQTSEDLLNAMVERVK